MILQLSRKQKGADSLGKFCDNTFESEKMEVLSLLFLITVTSAASYREEDPPCGRVNVRRRGSRIVEGFDASEGEFPWTVSIQSDEEHICGGAIIKQRTIISAAHCLDKNHLKLMNPENHNLTVVLGTRNLSNTNSRLSQRIEIKNVKFHKNYNYDPVTQRTKHDIALIELEEDIHWNKYISPVCLPPNDILFGVKDFSVKASGWGQPWGKPYTLRRSSGDFSEILQTIPLQIMSNDQCNYLYLKMSSRGGKSTIVPPHELCAAKTERDQSTGEIKEIQAAVTNRDSGSPLILRFQDQWTIVGVVKSIPIRAGPGIYSRVSSYLEWIKDNTHY